MHGTSAAFIHVTTITRADSLLLGGVFALLYRSPYWARVQKIAPYLFVVVVAAVATSVRLLPDEDVSHEVFSQGMRLWTDGLRYTVLALGAGSLIAWALRPGSVAGWIFERGWMRFFGKYSYGIYVLHMIMLGLLGEVSRAALLHLTHSKMLAVIGSAAFCLSLSVVAAYLSFHLYEKPFLRMKRWFEYKDQPDTKTAAGGVEPTGPAQITASNPHHLVNL
jgi:peptidoglycan/LPS O-acetylase OafA/YrhL